MSDDRKHRLSVAGAPQSVRHRSGDEVVVVSRADHEALRPTFKEYLLRGGPCADDDDDLDEIIVRNRAGGMTMMGRLPRTGE